MRSKKEKTVYFPPDNFNEQQVLKKKIVLDLKQKMMEVLIRFHLS